MTTLTAPFDKHPTPAGVRAPIMSNASSMVPVRMQRLELVFLLFFGFILRVGGMLAIIRQHPPMWLFTRGIEMGLIATSILNGEGLSSPFGGHTGPTALIGPVYPLMIASIFKFAGPYSLASEIIVLSLQVAVSVLNLWLLIRLAELVAGRQAAFLAGFFWVCSPPIIMMPTVFWDTTFTTSILTGMSLFVVQCHWRIRKRELYAAGALFALGSLLNSALFFTSIALLALLAKQLPKARIKGFAMSVALFLAVFSPWPVRNAVVLRSFVPFRSTIGLELWMGNHAGSTGHLEEKLFPYFNAAELADYASHGEIAYDREKKQLAVDYIRRHPRDFAELTVKRIARFWLGTGSRSASLVVALHAILTLTLGLFGAVLFVRHRGIKRSLPLLLPLLLFPLPYYITHAEFRYRLVIDPLLMALAAYGLSRVLPQGSTRGSVLSMPRMDEQAEAA
jgi:hypothetical protein